ncbi:hypothetical protein C8A05DRAFT_37348 [Staphylotrichum tortipilum]|uniref:Uncharacterized protein n=1 Tax=Staphylotrichum tortipilum TaxID=2831512 RepID=A0AAN6RQS6_9PEZI|nr:hypothetical protein C8A05DRAFT_37348 [Staphylotrichum longicolle]
MVAAPLVPFRPRRSASAPAVLHETLFLGGNAELARQYVRELGAGRIRKVRKLVLSYECHQDCHYSGSMGQALDWGPIFDFLREWWACPRQVLVHYLHCDMAWHKACSGFDGWRGNTEMEGECHTRWDEARDTFWCGLKRLTMVEKMEFCDVCPGYFVDRIARDNWWQVAPGSRGYDGVFEETFRGTLVNPAFPDEFERILGVHGRIDQGIEPLEENCVQGDNGWETQDKDPADDAEGTMVVANPKTAKPTTTFFDLPPEIRRMIFDYACVPVERECWPYSPKRWHTGTDIVAVSKRFAMEAIPAMYRIIRLYADDALETLLRLGSRACLTHARRLELYFACYCDRDWDRTGVHRTIRPESCVNPEAMWRDTFAVLSTEPARSNVREYDVTMFSCQRFHPKRTANPDSSWDGCAGLEESFLNLLAGLGPQMEQLSLSGDVPPSFAARMATDSRRGARMRLTWIDRDTRDFMTGSLSAWRSEGCPLRSDPLAAPGVWFNPTPHPDSTCTRDPHEVFLLVAETTAAGRWRERVADSPAGTPKESDWNCTYWRHNPPEMVRVGRYSLEGLPPWSDLHDVWDYASVSASDKEMEDWSAKSAGNWSEAEEAAANPPPQDEEDELDDPAEDREPEDTTEDEYDRRWAARLAVAARVTPWADVPIWKKN